jgi:uncharacterized protein (TIGR00661 family)
LSKNEKINNSDHGPSSILIAPLDWGLGHTTRCLPIIKGFLHLGADVTVAGNAKQAHLLREEIPSLNWIHMDGYDLSYSGTSWGTRLKLLAQIPKILTSIKAENRRIEEILREKEFDVVISDNRFGFYHKKVHSIFITHQLEIRVPFSKWLQKKLQQWNYHFINMFDECWIPDYESVPNLAGLLSHPKDLPAIPIKYIGPLSRFRKLDSDVPDQQFILILISGPEPQRTIFENILERQLRDFNEAAIVIRGLPGEMNNKIGFGNVSFINHLNSTELNELMQHANVVISRAGYSSIMDIVTLHKKSILIPTPGQTEQEYLASYLMGKKICVTVNQKSFSLKHDLDVARNSEYADMNIFQQNELFPAMKGLLHGIVGKTPQVNDFNH